MLRQGRSYDYFQAVRLLRLLRRMDGGAAGASLRFRPNLSLAFPESDLNAITGTNGYTLEPNFLALYGTSSPLPTFYTEDLIDEAREERGAVRDFLDIIHNVLYPLLYLTWCRYRAVVRVREERDETFDNELGLLIGLGERSLRQDVPYTAALMRYLGLFSQFPRCALGLKALLADFLGVPVAVGQCELRRIPIPSDQRMVIGEQRMKLGEDQYLGAEIDDRMATVLIRIGPLGRELFARLSPGGALHKALEFMITFYLVSPLRCEMELLLAAGEAPPLSLGGERPLSLGLDTWLLSEQPHDGVTARFEL
ncbi:MAG: type VI secretion system baseplate subunit TssG [Candidatus Binataceae bacterium]